MEAITIQVKDLERIVTIATTKAVQSTIQYYEKKEKSEANFNRNFSLTEAAKILGITRQTLAKRIKNKESLIRFNSQNKVYGHSLKKEFERVHGQK